MDHYPSDSRPAVPHSVYLLSFLPNRHSVTHSIAGGDGTCQRRAHQNYWGPEGGGGQRGDRVSKGRVGSAEGHIGGLEGHERSLAG